MQRNFAIIKSETLSRTQFIFAKLCGIKINRVELLRVQYTP